MNTSTGSRRHPLLVSVILVFVAAIVAPRQARAELVVLDPVTSFSDAVYLNGISSYPPANALRVIDFKSASAGAVTVQLVDVAFTDVLQSISVTLSRLGTTLLTRNSVGSFSFNISTDDTLTLSIYALPKVNKYAAYTIDASLGTQTTQVPLPAAGWMLASGLALLGGLRRRRSGGLARP